MDVISIVIGITVMAAAVALGYWSRAATHAMIPFRDPVFILILLFELIVLSISSGFETDGETITITDTGSILLLIVFAADAGFLMGHVMRRPGDVMQLDIPIGDGYQHSEVIPMVYYWRNGNLYSMPQSIGSIVGSLLGARHPLDMPVHEISRTRSYRVSNGGIRRPVDIIGAVTVSHYDMDNITIGLVRIGSRKIRDGNGNVLAESPVYLLHPKVTSTMVRFAQSATDDYQQYLVKTDLYRDSIHEAIESREELARLQIQLQSVQFDAAADIVSGIISMTRDAPGSHEEIMHAIDEIWRESRRRRDEDDDIDNR